MKEHSVKSLPTWAQEKIEYLQRDVDEAKEKLRKRFEQKPTHIIIDRYGDDAAYLDDRDHISFLLGKEEFIEFRFERDQKGQIAGVNVYASTFAYDSLGFFPSSGNTGRLLLMKTR